MNETPSLSMPGADDNAQDSTPRGKKEIVWEVVAKTDGLVTAQILVGRLKTEGILARAWQEGAGQALGLTVGLLGTGYVLTPKEDVEKAKQILDEGGDVDFDDVQFEDGEYDEELDPADEWDEQT